VDVHIRVFASQLGEEELGQWQLHQKVLIDSLAQDATNEIVVLFIVLKEIGDIWIGIKLVVRGYPGFGIMLYTRLVNLKSLKYSHKETTIWIKGSFDQLRKEFSENSTTVDARLVES